MHPPSRGPLAGLRILDLTRGAAGAVAGMLLADYGAEVLRVEPPGGDPLWDELAGYPVWHRGKQVIELDLRDARAATALRARAGVADALLESSRPGAMASLGLDFETLSAIAPRLVYVSISGYGQAGPDRDRAGYDGLVQAHAGVCHFQGASAGRPVPSALAWPSFGAGVLAVIGLLAALHERRRSGRGQWVETSLLDSILAQTAMFVVAAERAEAIGGPARLSGRAPTMGVYRCADGRFLQIHAGQRGAFERLLAATAIDATSIGAVGASRHYRDDPEGAERATRALAAAFASRPRDAWLEELARADVAAAPCLEPAEALEHPQTRAIGMRVEVNDPLLGPVAQAGLALRFAAAGADEPRAVVRRGATANPEAALRHGGWPTAEELADRTPTAPGAEAGRESESTAATSAASGDAPLAGVRVLDFGMFAAGPFAATLLAELGADVIKVEPLAGDTMRPAMRNFVGVQRGKRGLAIDLKSAGARDVIERLVRRSDVVLHNFRPGVAERLGIAWEDVSAWNPRIVYCHGSAYGSVGPLRDLPGFDQIYQAFCGLETLQGGVGHAPEQVAGAPLDHASALLSAAAILMALERRESVGSGERIECPQLAAALLATCDFYRTPAGLSRADRLNAERTGFRASYRLYEATDGWVFVCCPEEDARERFAALAGDDPEAYFAALGAADARARLADAGVPAELARDFLSDRMLDDPVLRATGRVAIARHPELGALRQAAGFVRFSRSPRGGLRAAPLLGEHTREVMRDLGLAPSEVERLHDEGVVLSASAAAP